MTPLPPGLFYGLGALLIVFGVLRAVHLGIRESRRDVLEDTAARRRRRQYHLLIGIVWTVMGLFLVASTAGLFGRR